MGPLAARLSRSSRTTRTRTAPSPSRRPSGRTWEARKAFCPNDGGDECQYIVLCASRPRRDGRNLWGCCHLALLTAIVPLPVLELDGAVLAGGQRGSVVSA